MVAKGMDVRWQQRFSNYKKALSKLSCAVKIIQLQLKNDEKLQAIDELMREGLIKRFEYTQELAWNVMKDYAMYQGNPNITGSRDAIRQAFSAGIIDDKRWMDTIAARNLTAHTYDEDTVHAIIVAVIDVYYPLFCAFEKKMSDIQNNSPTQSA